MELVEAVLTRRSIRRFRQDPVPRETIEKILDISRWSPSSRNTQPWELVVLGGKVMEQVKALLTEKVEANAPSERDVPEAELTGVYSERSVVRRDLIDRAQFPPGTENLEQRRADFWVRGGRFYDAPNAIIVCMDRQLYPSGLMSIGFMLQTISLAALAYGVGTCQTGRPVFWPTVLRQLLDIPESKLILHAIALGYPESNVPINNFERTREPVEAFTRWYGL